jgi:hypothetical protein
MQWIKGPVALRWRLDHSEATAATVGSRGYSFVTILKLLTRCGARMPLTGVEYRRVASRGALLAFVRAHRERLAAQPAVPEDVKFRKTQEIAGKEAE